MQRTVDPLAILKSIGIDHVDSIQPVRGGLDTQIWRVNCGASAYALRVFRPEQRGSVQLEAAAMRAAAGAGIPVATVHASGEWEERPFMLISWCPGEPMSGFASRQPWRTWSAAANAGRLQARLHRVKAPAEIRQRRYWLKWVKDPALVEQLRAISAADDALLHGDYHPRNILMSGGAITGVIDWTTVCAGDPRADVARTVTILLLAPVFRRWQRIALAPLLRLMAWAWLRGYSAEAGELKDMAPFYVWAGKVLRGDFAARIGQPGFDLTEKDLRPIDRWIERWSRQPL